MAGGPEFWGRTKNLGECHEDHRVRLDCPIRPWARRASRERVRFQILLGSAGPIALLSGSSAEAEFACQPHTWALRVWGPSTSQCDPRPQSSRLGRHPRYRALNPHAWIVPPPSPTGKPAGCGQSDLLANGGPRRKPASGPRTWVVQSMQSALRWAWRGSASLAQAGLLLACRGRAFAREHWIRDW